MKKNNMISHFVKTKWRKFFLILFLLFLVDILAGYVYYRITGSEFDKAGENRGKTEIDAVVILFGGFEGKTDIGDETARRVNYGLYLFKTIKAKNILCVGGAREKRQLYGSLLMKKKLVEASAPTEKILIEKKSKDTISNITEIKRIKEEKEWKNILLVSSAMHLYRIKKRMAEQQNNSGIIFRPYPYEECKPPISVWLLWKQIHHEWAASLLAGILPESTYKKVIDCFRN